MITILIMSLFYINGVLLLMDFILHLSSGMWLASAVDIFKFLLILGYILFHKKIDSLIAPYHSRHGANGVVKSRTIPLFSFAILVMIPNYLSKMILYPSMAIRVIDFFFDMIILCAIYNLVPVPILENTICKDTKILAYWKYPYLTGLYFFYKVYMIFPNGIYTNIETLDLFILLIMEVCLVILLSKVKMFDRHMDHP